MYGVNSRIDAIQPVQVCFLEILSRFIQSMMYIIQIMLVQKYPHACSPTPGNAEEASQLIQPRTSECVAPLLACTWATAMHDVNSHIHALQFV